MGGGRFARWDEPGHLGGGMTIQDHRVIFMHAFSVERSLLCLILEQSRLGSYYLKIN